MEKDLRNELEEKARENGEKHGKTAELDFGAGAEWMYERLVKDNAVSPYVSCRSIPEIIEKIEFYKSEQKRYERLSKDYPNDFDFKREMYGYASKVFALEWVLFFKNGS